MLTDIRAKLELPETEDSWDKISRGLDELRAIVCDDGTADQDSALVPFLRSVALPINSAMNSERTRLSGAAIDTLTAIVNGLGPGFEPLVPIFFPTLLALCARTNKITVSRARKSITAIIENTQLPSLLSYFLGSCKDKSVTVRLACAESTLSCLNSFNPPDLEKETRVHQIEGLVHAAGHDASSEVRQVAKQMYIAYQQLLPTRVESFAVTLSPTVKRTLGVKATTAASLAVPRPKSAAASTQKAATKLSSSASAVPEQCPPRSQTAMAQHVRSASTETFHGPSRPTRTQGKMAPPDIIPAKNSQPMRPTATSSRPVSYIDANPKRPQAIHAAHSAPSRPTSAQSTQSTDGGKSGSGSLSSSRSGPSRVKPLHISAVEHDRIVTIARRIPLPDDDHRPRSFIDNASSSSSLNGPRRAPAPQRADSELTAKPGLSGHRKPPIPVFEGSKPAKPKVTEAPTAPKGRPALPASTKAASVPTVNKAPPAVPSTRAPGPPTDKTSQASSAGTRTLSRPAMPAAARSRTQSKPAPPARNIVRSETESGKAKAPAATGNVTEPSKSKIGKPPQAEATKPMEGIKKSAASSRPVWGARTTQAKPGFKPTSSKTKSASVSTSKGRDPSGIPEAKVPLPVSPKLDTAVDLPSSEPNCDPPPEDPHSSGTPSPAVTEPCYQPEPMTERVPTPPMVQGNVEVLSEQEPLPQQDVCPSTQTEPFPVQEAPLLSACSEAPVENTDSNTPILQLPATPKVTQHRPVPQPTPISQLFAAIEQGFVVDTPAPTPAPPRPVTPEDLTPIWRQFPQPRIPLQDVSLSDYLMSPINSFPMDLNSPGKIERVMKKRQEEAQRRAPLEDYQAPHYELQSDFSIAFDRFNPGQESEW